MTINKKGIDLIKSFEGLSLKSYRCPAGVLTIGYGHTRNVTENLTITESQAEALLLQDLQYFIKEVDRVVKIRLTDNQFSALVSFAFNLGIANLTKSTLLRCLNSGDIVNATNQFVKWNRAGGKVLEGLTRRRVAERNLFQEA